ncbi:hypothetical protein J6X90_02200 [Candidatus Saccharibacteria bacterium]|nr:hypothetical protein [Candidatus Saccharibacteria bacterium]
MKKDLISALLVAIVGVAVAYIVTGMFISEPEAVSYKTVDSNSLSSDLPEPDDKVFNYLALNHTVEVYIGGCGMYDANGDCIDDSYYARLLQQSREKQLNALGYYDMDGYFHKYEYDETGFYDYNDEYFTFEDDGYRAEDGTFYHFDDVEKGYYDGHEYKDVNNGDDFENEQDEEDDEYEPLDDGEV